EERLVLPVRQAVDRLCARRIVRAAFRQPDAAAREERMDAVETRATVKMAVVVGSRVERPERREALAYRLHPVPEQLVECDRSGGGVREPERLLRGPRRRESMLQRP